ncbi:hypothetical protein [Candidatus Nitrosocosmicus sp. T]
MAVAFAYGPPEFVIGFFIFFILLSVIIWAIRAKMSSSRNNEPQQYYYNQQQQPSPYYYDDRQTGGSGYNSSDRSYNGSPVKDSYSGGNYDKERYDSNGRRIV